MQTHVRKMRLYHACTTDGHVVVVTDTYAQAGLLLLLLGYDVTDMRGVVPGTHPHAWHNVISTGLCPDGCGCRLGTEDADRLDCACDGPCCF